MKLNVIYNENCLQGIPKRLPDKSVNLIVVDPPYNINKAEWDKIPNYINWCGKWILECQRVLKDNGSFYWFHNNIPTISRLVIWLEENTDFVFKQFIVWNKKFKNAENEGYLQGYNEVDGLRNYQRMAEYLLFYTFQDETGSSAIYNNPTCFKRLKEYFYNEKKKGKFTNKDINRILGTATNGSGMAGHYFKFDKIQWILPTKKMYQKLQKTGYFRIPYEDLRSEYENLRYTFNNQKTHHSVWNYEIAKKNDHLTPKPILLIENILKHSSNKGDVVLIPFVGSGNDCIACQNLGRRYIGFEINPKYCEIAKQRLSEIQLELV